MKKYLSILLIIALLLSSSTFAVFADQNAIKVTKNSLPISLWSITPIQSGSDILLPVLSAYTALGATNQQYNETKKEHIIKKGNTTIIMTLGDKKIKVSGKGGASAPLKVVNNVVYVSYKFVASSLGLNVTYDAKLREVKFMSRIPGGTATPSEKYDNNLFPVHSSGIGYAFGYVDRTGKLVIPYQFGSAQPFQEGLAAVSIDRKYGFINTSGKVVIKPEYDAVESFKNGFARVKMNGKFGFIDKTGKLITKIIFDNAYDFSDGLAAVGVEASSQWGWGKYEWGYINTKGEVVIPIIYHQAYDFSEGYGVIVTKNPDPKAYDSSWCFIDKQGNIVSTYTYIYASQFNNGYALVQKHDSKGYRKSAYVDKSFKEVLPQQYDILRPFINDIALVYIGSVGGSGVDLYPMWRDGAYHYIDRSGKQIGSNTFKEASDFNNGFAIVSNNDKYSFLDTSGQYLKDLQFEKALDFSDDLAAVQILDEYKQPLWGFIDKQGIFKIKAQYTDVESFQDGYAIVRFKDDKNNSYNALIDKAGKIIYKSPDKVIKRIDKHVYAVGIFGMFSNIFDILINEKGQTIWAEETK